MDNQKHLKERITSITILCKDGSKRIIKCQGIWNQGQAKKLGQDIENENFLKNGA